MSDSHFHKRALVTGATGYIGSNLVRHLLTQGWDVHIVTRANSGLKALDAFLNDITVHRHDGTSPGMVKVVANAKPDIVFHLASLYLAHHKTENIEALISSNLLFSTQLVEAMAVNGVKYLINTGTSWQHYNNEDYNPVNLYAATKQAFEDILTWYIEAHSLIVATMVLFDTYGPNDSRGKLLSAICKAAISKEPIDMSPGNQFIDLVHVDDVANAFLIASKEISSHKARHERYGISSSKPIRLQEVVRLFEEVNGLKVPISWGKRKYRDREVMVTWDNYKKLPNWAPTIPLETGLIDLYNKSNVAIK